MVNTGNFCKVGKLVNLTYSLLLFVSGSISLIIAGVAWRRRPSAGAAALAVTMISMVVWTWMYAMFWLTPVRSIKFFWLSLSFVGVVITSPAFLVLAGQFSGKVGWPTRRVYLSLSILPVLIIFSLWTEPWLDLFFGEVDFLDPESALKGGLGFSLSALNAYGTTAIAVIFLVRALRTALSSRREQIILILIGTGFPLLAGTVSVLQLSPFPGLDLTPVAFSVSGIFYAYAMFGYKMMDLAPMGRESVVEVMDYGVLVTDDLNRIIDINPSALSFLGFQDKSLYNSV